jgi:holo-[acyl-carrier protein] synthase
MHLNNDTNSTTPPRNASPQDLQQAHLILGTDLVYVPRLRVSFQRYGEAFFQKLLTPGEWAYCQGVGAAREPQRLRRAAGRIAMKEAVAKALGLGINGLGWTQGAKWKEIEVLGQSQSPPSLCLHGRALETAVRLGVTAWRCSLSHDGDYAMATAIGLIGLT